MQEVYRYVPEKSIVRKRIDRIRIRIAGGNASGIRFFLLFCWSRNHGIGNLVYRKKIKGIYLSRREYNVSVTQDKE